MNCERIEGLWSRRLAGALEEPEERDFTLHLAGCDACRTRQAARERALARFETLPRGEPSPAVWAGIEEKIGREMTTPPARSFAWLMPAWGVGIAAAVLAVVLMHPSAPAFFRVESPRLVRINGIEGTSVMPGDTVETTEPAEFSGPGGIRVGLAGGSRVRFDADALRLERGEMVIDSRGPARVVAAEADIAIDGRVAVTRTGRIEADIRVHAGSARVGGVAIPAGSWTVVLRNRPVRRQDDSSYERYVRERGETREAGRRAGKIFLESTTPEERERLWNELSETQEELVAHGGGRLLAELTAGVWEIAMALAPGTADEVHEALVGTFAEGEWRGLPAGWFFQDDEELPAAEPIKDDLERRLEGLLTPGQMKMARRLMEDED